MFGATPTEADHAFVTTMSDIWVRFAETGNPNGGGRPDWPAYTSTNEAYMELGETLAPKERLRMAQTQLIEDVLAEERSRQP